jgi:hypothetical protein
MPKNYRIETTGSDSMSGMNCNEDYLKQAADVIRYMKEKNYHIGKVSYLLFCEINEPELTL